MPNQPLIVALDLEGVLVPEVWIAVAEKTGVDALRLTTRDVADYDELMRGRLRILRQDGIDLNDIQKVISSMGPLPGAKEFLDSLRERFQVVILSDTYYEFASPLMAQLDWPALFCNSLEVDEKGMISNYHLRLRDGKRHAVRALRELNFTVAAAGDSYNDTTMLAEAHLGVLFCPSENVTREFPQYPVAEDYIALENIIAEFSELGPTSGGTGGAAALRWSAP